MKHHLVAGVTWAVMTATMTAQEAADLDVLLDQLATYLQVYESQLSLVVADENYLQEERRRGNVVATRMTDAEVLFLRLPGEAEWFGVRDVNRVDRKLVARPGVTLLDLLKSPGKDLLEKAAAIVEASSRHNLGGRRTINMPTVPLEALSARNHPRYIFKVRGKARIAGVQTQRLDFEEFDEPTLVQAVDGGALWSRGTVWLDPTSGAIWRAELIVGPDKPGSFRQVNVESRIRVEYRPDAALGMMVPRELSENFWVRGGLGYGKGKYSNFRRFTTGGRLIP